MKKSASKPSVAVVILNWNNYKETAECLRSLENVSYENMTVVVVDNGSDDESPDQIDEEFDVKLIRREVNGGFSAGNNTGIKWALSRKIDYVFLLNNDTVLDSNTIERLVTALEETAEYGIATPKLYYYDEGDVLQAFGAKAVPWKANTVPYGNGEQDSGQFNERISVEHANGAAMLIDREVIEDVGLLNEDYGFYTEDLDYCYRARKAGHGIVAVPDTAVWHKVSASAGTASPFTAYYTVRSKIIFVRHHGRIGDWVRFVPYLLYFIFYRVAAHLRHGNAATALAAVRGFVHGLRGRTGLRSCDR